MSNTITWLHLSDLHYCECRTGWDAGRVLSSLENDLRKMQKDHGLQPDFIFFTGDIAYGDIGGRPGETIQEQFDGAARFFERVRNCFEVEVPIQNVFLVPGNHDVNRNYVTEDQMLWLENQHDEHKIISLIKDKGLQWQRFAERLGNYRSFLEQHFPHLLEDPDRLIYSITRLVNSRKVKVAGLNSAWSSSRHNEKAKLWMAARWQIEHLAAADNEADLSIALSHHPSNWLVEYEDPHFARHVERDFDFSLHGHEHQSWVTQSGDHIRIAAGACYDRSDKPNGYNFVRLNISTGTGELWLRKYHSVGGAWIPEIDPTKTTNDGLWSFTLSSTANFPIKDSPSDDTVPITISGGSIFKSYGSDLRPVIDAWVGREQELEALERTKSGVVVVTGIGGQGKSALVSKYVEAWIRKNPQAFWDWRDCREESDRFLTQLVAMMEHLTQGELSADFSKAEVKAVVRYWFELVGMRSGVVVLDNVDSYVSEYEGKFKLAVGVFVQEALRVAHNLLIVLTCRPRVYYPSPRYLEIPLRGVTLDEAIELFELREVKVKDSNQQEIEEIWSRTDGHPLWLNLIAVQMFRSPMAVPRIIEELRRGADDRTRSMFRALWKGLNERQRTLLRCMAEISYPETKDSIRNLMGSLVRSPNQFSRAFEGTRALSLVVERQSEGGQNRFDLHPLVRSFVRTEFATQKERLLYIRTILGMLVELFLRSKTPSEGSSLEELQRWTAKAELELASSDIAAALSTLKSTSDQLIARAFHEEFFRVAKLILDEVEWDNFTIQDLPAFHDVVGSLIQTLAEHSREVEARHYLSRYEAVTSDRTVARVQFCAVAAYVEWFVGNFDTAIALGQEGVKLKTESGIDTLRDSSHTLALALRDNGRYDEALKIFAPDLSLDQILEEDYLQSERGASFYGNVGRCLQLKGQLEAALSCYVKSYLLLKDSSGAVDILNRGYACLWIGETLENLGNLDAAYYFYRRAGFIWTKRSPLRLSSVVERLEGVIAAVDDSVRSVSDNVVDLYCQDFISSKANEEISSG